ncbi:MAG: amino acid permease, partial [Nitrososphaera sp.]|nr:amino acid permease [Nitrososphaera sp.]
ILFVLYASVLTGVVHYSMLGDSAPVALAVDKMNVPILGRAMKLGAIAGLTSVMLVMLMAQPRIFWIMAGDGLLPRWFAQVHARFRTPHITTMLTCGAVALVGALFPIDVLGKLVSIGTLFAFVLVCLGVWVMRHTKSGVRRPFRTPWVPLVPLMGILCCLALMIGLGRDTWERLVIWMAPGIGIYALYGIRSSNIGRAQGVPRRTLLAADFALMSVSLLLILLGQLYFTHKMVCSVLGGILLVLGLISAATDRLKDR